MIIKLKPGIGSQPFETLLQKEQAPHYMAKLYGDTIIVLNDAPSQDLLSRIKAIPGVDEFISCDSEIRLGGRSFKKEKTSFDVAGQEVGGNQINIIAGPCSVESEEQIFSMAENLSKLGVKFIRGGAYKPRTSPYRFQGMGHEGLKLIREAADAYGLRVVTEIIDSSLIDEIFPYADIFQVGSRNMMNYHFLKELGKIDKPILLKRGMAARVDEWLMAAEYILAGGNGKVILCERGIRTFDSLMRNTMDIGAIPLAQQLSHLPVFADPSHGTGRSDLVIPVALGTLAAGADGLMIEVHPHPQQALSDGRQSLSPDHFKGLLQRSTLVAKSVGRELDAALPTTKDEEICAG